MNAARCLCAMVLLMLLAVAPPGHAATFEAVQFIAYGDLPYSMAGKPVLVSDGRSDQAVFDDDIRPAIRDHAAAFVIHVGDVGRPETSCSDDDLLRHKAIWQQFGKPVFYTIGDNDWIDCIRASIPGGAKSPLERLAHVRSLLFSDTALASYQGTPPGWSIRHGLGGVLENTAWTTTNPAIAFLTLHIIGSCNGRDTFGKEPCKLVPELGTDETTKALIENAAERDRRNLVALREAYAQAESQHRAVLVIAIQADMFGKPDDDVKHPDDIWKRCKTQTEFKPYCDVLPILASAFPGTTLLIHGDTSAYCLEQLPLEATPEPGWAAKPGHQFWRLNTPGDFGEIDASVVTISPGESDLPSVKATGLLSGEPAPAKCDQAQYAYKENGTAQAYPQHR